MDNAEPTDGRRTAHAWYEQGRFLADSGKHKEAVHAFSAALKEDPEFAEAYFGRSASNYLLGRYSQANEDLDAASLLGCRDAQFWSRYESGVAEDADDKGETPT